MTAEAFFLNHFPPAELFSGSLIEENMKIKILLITLFCILSVQAQTVSFSFDDAPTPASSVMTGTERTALLLENLKKAGIDTAVFYCIGQYIEREGKERIDLYSQARHLIANHSVTHGRIRNLTAKVYVDEIAAMDKVVSEYETGIKLFRYPFLDEGRTREERDSVRNGLNQLGYSNGYVTVDNYDWYINALYNNAVKEGKKIDMEKLKRLWLDHITGSIMFYDQIARKYLGRSPHHVLLLHENDLAAMFIDDLAEELKAAGWKFVSPKTAYSDPVASQIPDVLFNGQGRVAALANAMGVKPAELVQESEDEEYLDKIFAGCIIK